MSLLLLFDETLSIDAVFSKIVSFSSWQGASATLYLFPLTSHFLVIQQLEEKLKVLPTLKVQLIESGQLINNAVSDMQTSITTWSLNIAEHLFLGKSIKDWFNMPDKVGSAWWFGLISEKNSVQSQAFLKIAQLNAICKFLNDEAIENILLSLKHKDLKLAIKQAANKSNIKLEIINAKKAHFSFKQKILQFMEEGGLKAALLAAPLQWAIWLRQSSLAKKRLPPLKKRLPQKNPFLLVSYFPNIDREQAQKNIFVNKYTLPLEKNLKSRKVPITWLLMPVFYNGYRYDEAMDLAKRFSEHGEKLVVLQEFFDFKIFIKSIYWWFKQTVKSISILSLLDKQLLVKNLSDKSALPIIKNIWHHSFTGSSGIRGIIFYLSFCKVFKTIPEVKDCLYFCEMQSWEKALLLAKKKENPKIHTLAFQHTIVSRNFFHYFYHPHDVIAYQRPSDFPLPDKLIANGKKTYELLKESGFPNLMQAEAIRQLYLKERKKISPVKHNRPVLFVAGSYDRCETKSLLTMLHVAFPKASAFDIWLKGSPINPLEPLFLELEIDLAATHYKICNEDVASLLNYASVAFIANTTVAIEAAAQNIPVIIPLFADTMLMNPILSTDATYDLVSSCAQLFKLVNEKIVKQLDEALTPSFIDNYWNLDASLPLWNKILDASAIKI